MTWSAVPSGIATVLAETLAIDPDRPALVAPDRSLTYAELDRAADRAAAALHALGLRPGDRVGVSLPNDSRIVGLFHGAQRLGLIWVGLNRALADVEQAAILDDCQAALSIGCPEGPNASGRRSLLEDEWTVLLDATDMAPPRVTVDPHAPAAIAYTSGTTGRPKGVVHSQHNLLLPGAALVADRGYDRTLRKADCLPLTILNLLVLSTLTTSQAGGTSLITGVMAARRLVPWLQETRATVWNGVPPQLYDLAHDADIGPQALDGLQEIWSGGDNLSEDIRRSFAAKFHPPLCGTYGLTEGPTIVSIERRTDTHQPGCSGTVLPHLTVTARDSEGLQVPEEELGELCVSAADVGPLAGIYTPMLGYWRDSEATAATLAGGVLRTGDIGRVTADGRVFVHDRSKLVIVRGGANIYPAEVERLLQSVPGVLAACVLGVPDARLGARLAAVVQTSRPGSVGKDDLAELCAAELSRYKVPERWHMTSEPLPRNAMGKLDRSQIATLLPTLD